jgi:hypothetical protein
MRLNWTSDNNGHDYIAEGTHYAYKVTTHREGSKSTIFRVEQERQQGGQIVNASNTASLEGAFACAQVWENREYLRR